MVTHHPECDGYRFEHLANAVTVHPRMVRAECERCEWQGPKYSAGTGDKTARREANDHTAEVACDGRCRDWD